MKFKLIFIITFIILVAMAWQPTKIYLLQYSCSDYGGKWAPKDNVCIYQNCAETQSCQSSYRNNAICKELKIGITQNKLYFHLGMPIANSDNNFIFTGGGSESKIEATILGGKVVKLQCGS